MAIYVNYTPTSIIGKAMFNFDASGISNFKYSGAIKVSLSDGFSNYDYLLGIVNSTDYTMNPYPNEINWALSTKNNVQETLSIISSFANLSFTNLVDYDTSGGGLYSIASPADVGMASDINISLMNANSPFLLGISSGPSDLFGYSGSRGDVLINYTGLLFPQNVDFADFTKSRQVLMHELGHSLGLSHPHSAGTITSDYAATKYIGFDQFGFRTNTASDMNKEYFSIMSYDDQNTYIPDLNAYTPMILDVIALQQAYGEGSGTSGSGNDTIQAGTYGYRTYFDKGGTDTVDLSMYTDGVYFHMGAVIVSANHLVGVAMSLYDAENTITYAGNPVSLRWFYGEYENATGSSNIDFLIGNTLANNINGLGGDDYIYGGDGNDALAGGYGNDWLTGQLGDDTFDWDVDSREGNDTFIGGAGNDTYCIQGEDNIVEYFGEGVDSVWVGTDYSLANNYLENLYIYTNFTGNYTLKGNAYNNLISGSYGNETIDGVSGNDSLYGGAGKDSIDGGEGNDTIAGGLGDDELYGGIGNDSINGGDGGDFIDGGADNDTMAGGLGDDLYVYDPTSKDMIIELTGEGNDYLVVTNSFSLLTAKIANVESLWGLSETGITLTGNKYDNDLFGYLGNDNLIGDGGNDTLVGMSGKDTLAGGLGNDTLNADWENDSADTFLFNSKLGPTNIDILNGFVGGLDKLAIDDAIFTKLKNDKDLSDNFITNTATTTKQCLIYDNLTGVLSYDADGNGKGAAVQFVTLTGHPNLIFTDFIIV